MSAGVWVFSGHGSQWAGMGAPLLEEPSFAATIDALEPVFLTEIGFSPRQALAAGDLEGVDRIQTLIFAMQVGLTELLRSRGAEPAAVIGHSVGEIAAAVAAGALSLDDGARLICRRSLLLRRAAGNGAMLVAMLPFGEAERQLAGRTDAVAAIASAPAATVVAGTPEALRELAAGWQAAGVGVRKVASDVAFHSPHMDPLLDDLKTAADGLRPRPYTVPVYSTALPNPRTLPSADGAYWAANLRNPVRLVGAITAAVQDGHRAFLEISPHPVVAHSISRTLAALGITDGFASGTLRRGRPQLQAVESALAALAASRGADQVTLDAVECCFPDRIVTVEERAAQLDLNPAQTHMFRRIQGLDRMHYDPDVGLFDLLLPAARKVLEQARDVRYLIYGRAYHGVPSLAAAATGADTGTDTAEDIRRQLGLTGVTAFTLTQQNCAIPLTAIDVAGAMLRADGVPGAQALIVTGDKPRIREAQVLRNNCIVADGGAACLVSLNGTGAVIRSFATASFGEFSDGMLMSPERAREGDQARPGNLLGVMEEAARRAGCTLGDMQIVIPTNLNTTYWAKTVKDPALRSKFYIDNVPRYSHCLGADVFINYVTLRDDKCLAPDHPAMFVSVGIGRTFSAMVFVPAPDEEGARL